MKIAAIAYALLVLAPAFVQAALTFGAPWGVLTLGGKWPGRLPVRLRFVTALQCLILLGLGMIALDLGGVLDLGWPRWLVWPFLGITAMSTLANLTTPSRPERRLWGPIMLVLLISACVLVFG